MNVLDEAEELRQKAISLLLNQRQQIDERLAQLGHGQEQKSPDTKRRGRPRKQQDPELSSDQSGTTESVAP